VPSQRIVLERNPYYRGPRPRHVDRFVFDLTVDENQALDDVLNGTADYAWVPNSFYSPRAAEFARRFGVNKTRYFVKPGTFLHLFALNTSRPLLRNNASLRRAINFAIERSALLGQLPGPLVGTPVDHYVLPIMPGYRSTQVYPRRKPDVTRARALAKGHTRSGKLVLYVPTRAGAPAQAQIVKQDLGRIGLHVDIHTFPAGPLYFEKLANPKEPFDMAWIGFAFTTPDPGSFGGLFDGSTIGKPGNANVAYLNSPRWNRALRQASRLTGEARYRAFGRLDIELARDEAPYVAYGVDNAITLVSSRTGCVVVNPALDLDAVCLK
jgi:peptide/nickel transport system substrate-binding protein